jgi:hypothetical protein
VLEAAYNAGVVAANPLGALAAPPHQIRLPTSGRALRSRTRKAYYEGLDVVWLASRDTDVRHGVAALNGWRPAHLSVFHEEHRRVVWLAHNPERVTVLQTWWVPRASWFRCCRRCGRVDVEYGWESPDGQAAHQLAGAFACAGSGCGCRAYDWRVKQPVLAAPGGRHVVQRELSRRPGPDVDAFEVLA